MKIEHIAFWTEDIDRLAHFYVEFFGAKRASRYVNQAKGFESCFLSFAGGARIEIMRTTKLEPIALPPGAQRIGLTHLALAVGSEAAVDALSRRIANEGLTVLDGPRRTGDGYYESVVLDPDGNRVEITAG